MSETDIELGPIDWVIVEWPPGSEPNGKGLDMLVDLTERGIIRSAHLGDVDGAFAAADIVWERTYRTHRHTGLPLEMRACIADFDPDRGRLLAWLRGIAANVLRAQFRRPTAEPLAAELVVAPDDAGPLQREQAEQIGWALTQLPERYEAVLRAKYLEHRSVAEIAAKRNETPKAIESLLTRARQAFREAFPRSE